ncbi:MAG: hypothetical protein M1322_02325 [Candidatus Parvarchaeota archaeon]|jgi:hypothetical protein|nr:hypothetical protein [Candidatus Parvarchaeota archaeon]MCL5106927.1 hypothetical protein [Candidatus Parvarchaeota archaeon]
MEDINEIYDKIMEKLREGPSLILEIAERIEKDTLQTQTIVDYFAAKGEIKKTARKFGSSPVYFLEKDRERALNLLMQTFNSQEKALIAKIRERKVVNVESLSSAERYISQNLADFMKKVSAQDNQTGQKADYLYEQGLSLDVVKSVINSKDEKQKQIPHETSVKRTKESKELADQKFYEVLIKNGFQDPKEVERGVFLCSYGQYKIKSIVQVLNKKAITKRDFINAMGYSTMYKTITFILTNADKISGNKSFGNMVNVIKTSI